MLLPPSVRVGRIFLLTAGLALAVARADPPFDAAQATNRLGLDLYRQVAPGSPGNLLLSPYSIETTLAMAFAGAAGLTRTEMAGALGFPNDDRNLQASLAGQQQALSELVHRAREGAARDHGKADVGKDIEWRMANRLYGQKGYAFRQPFLTALKQGYGSPFETLDFRGRAEQARGVINAWAEKQTAGKIRNLIPAGGVGRTTRLVLVNALYLRAPWATPFERRLTADLPFYPGGGARRQVPTMARSGYFSCTVDSEFTAVAIPFLGEGLDFLILLPPEGQGTEALAKKLTPELLRACAAQGPPRHLELYLPKFRLEGASIALRGPLEALGVRSAFDDPPGSADFGRMAERKPGDWLAFSEVFHQTFLALDESGVEAAAATAVVMRLSSALSAPPLVVRVDHPFIFAIRVRATGLCLFVGRVTNPLSP